MGWQTEAVVQLIAGDTIINPSGAFTYSAAPGSGDLIASITPAAGTDSFGNQYLEGITTYGSTTATQLLNGFISFYTGSLSGGWSLAATQQFSAFGIIQLSGGLLTANNTVDDGSGNASVSGALSVTGQASVGSLVVNGSGNTGDPSVDATIVTTSGNFNGGTLTSHNHSYGHTHPF